MVNVDKRLLPSISMLAAFDATARTGSFSRAARELHVTHGAISRQVQALEGQLGVPLFMRSARGVRLTAIGERYAVDVRSVLTALRSASLKIISDPTGCTIDLAVLPTFGTRWLIPRLPRFLEENPGITVNFVTQPSRSGIQEGEVDVAILNATPDWSGADSTFLMGEPAYPVCSPALLERFGDDIGLAASDLPLLGLRSRPAAWKEWLAADGRDFPADSNTMEFEQFSAVAHAAVAGLGVALLPRFLITTELERGTLVIASDRATESEMAYHLAVPRAKRNYEPVLTFRRWLLDTIELENRDARHAEQDEPELLSLA